VRHLPPELKASAVRGAFTFTSWDSYRHPKLIYILPQTFSRLPRIVSKPDVEILEEVGVDSETCYHCRSG